VTVVVSDTSVITSLMTIGMDSILSALYERILIPAAVDQELRRAHEDLPAFLLTCSVKETDTLRARRQRLDAGEAEAITLALEVRADLVLMDESKGRAVAVAAGLSIMGLMGVLLEAKRRNVISDVEPLVVRLESEAGFRLSASVKQLVLRKAGERP
jgi:predicted nucleic acid-binding protein